jgi:hypothetical protein
MSTAGSGMSQKFKVGRPKKGTGFGYKKPCPICGNRDYVEETYVAHLLTHDVLDVCKKLEQFDETSRKCNVCKKFLIVTSTTAKTFSSHPCQRRLRENLKLAIARLATANAAVESARTKMQRVAAVRRVRQAKKNLEHAKAANSGSEDPEDLR